LLLFFQTASWKRLRDQKKLIYWAHPRLITSNIFRTIYNKSDATLTGASLYFLAQVSVFHDIKEISLHHHFGGLSIAASIGLINLIGTLYLLHHLPRHVQ